MKPTLNSAPAAAAAPVVFKTRPAARIGDGSRTSRRGFASMDPAEQRRIASEGGKASHASGQGHKWTAEEAREAGRKGGLTSRRGPKRPATDAPAKVVAKSKTTK
jgi:general stress protein YciG